MPANLICLQQFTNNFQLMLRSLFRLNPIGIRFEKTRYSDKRFLNFLKLPAKTKGRKNSPCSRMKPENLYCGFCL